MWSQAADIYRGKFAAISCVSWFLQNLSKAKQTSINFPSNGVRSTLIIIVGVSCALYSFIIYAVSEVDGVLCISVPSSRDVDTEFVYRLIVVRLHVTSTYPWLSKGLQK